MSIDMLPFYIWLGDVLVNFEVIILMLWVFFTIAGLIFYLIKLEQVSIKLSKTFVTIYISLTLIVILTPSKKVVYTYAGVKVGQELNNDYNLSNTTIKTLRLVNMYLDKELENKEK